MNETGLNIEYICKKTLLNKDNKLVPIILDLMQECYRAGLCQAEYDNTMNLIEENQELKQKYENAVADYEKTRFEKEQLNSLINSCQEEIRQLKKQLKPNYYVKGLEGTIKEYQQEMNKVAIQQKEFIKYIEDMLDDENDIFSVVRVKDVLQKYRSIIGEAR